jgi:hypothetical protein
MKNFLLGAVFSVIAAVSPASAQTEYFHESYTGPWVIFGDSGDADRTPACVVQYDWKDGSYFQLVLDMHTLELFILFENFEWNIKDAPGEYSLNMVILNDEELVSGKLGFILEDKNSIYIPGIQHESFINAFMSLDELRFIMPGDTSNAYLNLEGSREAIEHFFECVATGNKKTSVSLDQEI